MKPALFALLFGGLAFITLASVVYAYVQQAEAKRQALLAIECEKIIKERDSQLSLQIQALQQAVNEATQKALLLETQASSKSKNKNLIKI